jgi:hypothetical protein
VPPESVGLLVPTASGPETIAFVASGIGSERPIPWQQLRRTTPRDRAHEQSRRCLAVKGRDDRSRANARVGSAANAVDADYRIITNAGAPLVPTQSCEMDDDQASAGARSAPTPLLDLWITGLHERKHELLAVELRLISQSWALADRLGV